MKTKRETGEPQNAPAFLFRGNAVAAGGFLTKLGGTKQMLDSKTVSTHGESCLPLVGGVSHSLIENPKPSFSKNIDYGKVETFAEGRHKGGLAVTMLRAEVNGVSLTTAPSPGDKVPEIRSITFRAGKVLLEVETAHPRKGQARFTVKPSQPEGMALEITDTSGNVTTLSITLDFDDRLLSLKTMDEMDRAFMKNRKFFDDCAPRFHSTKKLVYGRSRMPRTPHGYVLGSIVRQIHVGDEQIQGNVLTKKGFGTIQFGVMQAEPFSRRISMARVKMGSDPEAEVGLSGVETNGIWT